MRQKKLEKITKINATNRSYQNSILDKQQKKRKLTKIYFRTVYDNFDDIWRIKSDNMNKKH